MRAFTGEELLTAWERTRELPEQEAALALLALALPERSMNELARLPLGDRNALLLELRATTFGRRMEGFAMCPDCAAPVEFTMDPRELAKGLRADPLELVKEPAGYSMRPVNSLDLFASGRAASEEQARAILLARTLGIEEPELEKLGDSSALLLERFERINASAEIRLQLECSVCRNRPSLDLDIARFLVREFTAAARRLMTEIHELARAYGWGEGSIAAMSPARRAAYLEILSA